MTTNREEMEKLKLLMLEAETAGQLAALIIDFTHEEIMQVYSELVLEQQARIQAIWKYVVLTINT
ncbi:hypothetical protein [Kamptonema sp. UHCC 0994]|uniref:hypothetical protein n=1 Tax=Kamptonema sp. UHCC 0994 TaxID=3031329 RepID=UPI0023B907BD|nr:hypothetical protein [Kamptonema sp. UHCC 0994]MDF0552058.1 hypothetical protein [Kamptonema sp. UHCC 0994]